MLKGNGTNERRWPGLARAALRFAVIVVIVYSGHLAANWLLMTADSLPAGGGARMMMTSLLALMLVAYTLLMAVPFVPGIEIGVALLMFRGAQVAPFVYLATLTGLILAFLAGRYLSYAWLSSFLRDLRLRRAANLVDEAATLSYQERLDMLKSRLPKRLGPWLVDWRYAVVAVILNVPGNAVIGGGGGIALIAGLSRLCRPAPFILTVALAVSPVPIMVMLFGTGILGSG